jgi:hypothetical protein
VESDFQSLIARAPEGSLSIAKIRQTYADMKSAADYANAISLPHVSAVDRGEARWRLLSALESAFALGQLVALPTLANMVASRDDVLRPPLIEGPSWLSVESGWAVLDSDGICVGFVQHVHGDRDTGEFECVDVASNVTTRTFSIPAASVSAINAGEIRLSVSRAQAASADS